MTTNIPRRGLSPSKSGTAAAASRTSSAFFHHHHHHQQQQPGRATSRAAPRKSAPDAESIDAYNDKNTVALIRRVLCPEASSSYGSNTPRPLQELLPPLTSSNEIDLQLYALLAIIIKEFVYSWYAKITTDHVFIDEVLQLIAHCTRALEQRLRQVDVNQLALDEIPGLLEAHIVAYRTAKQGSNLVCIPSPTQVIYHQLNPHPSLSPPPDGLYSSPSPEKKVEQQENERLYRHLLAQGVLAVLLPTEDLENVCLRTLVEDILSDLLLGNEVSGKICEGWFIWTTVSKAIQLAKRKGITTTEDAVKSNDGDALGRLERFGLLSNDGVENNSPKNNQSWVSIWIWKALYTAYLFYLTLRFVIGGLFRVGLSSSEDLAQESASPDQSIPAKSPTQEAPCRPVLDYRSFALVSQWTRLSQRMPWVTGSLALMQNLVLEGPGKMGATNSVIDRFLREMIDTYILTPEILPTLLLAARTTLFPSNSRPNAAPNEKSAFQQQQQQSGSDNVDTPQEAQSKATALSAPEIAAIKRQCATDILSLFPRSIAQAFFCGTVGSTTEPISHVNTDEVDATTTTVPAAAVVADDNTTTLLEAIETDLLDPFSDAYCNKHLIFAVVESVLVKLLPELSERGITELMEERGVSL
ncbi:Elongation factor G 1 [Talaromyces islandicus]|uniref:Elongation factor G 1 n=1 Tax=Talaromyces islandicus TaxID=28573 RepID=A0A0U1LQV5_TALIS|nr:Elongation factor G 1 [Talaromyces islandicus]